ncbi:1174_t:CDS:1 [Cetraspora pellucida]|uniref:1174_t:CDS:1 n=1 Tax=Cetraspora pellucida TaxID=1433469 RepID=A0ACA9KBY9_9GLOM|nr:1174_t:CDS:1 [Cetraspora pellucida]
MTQRPTIEFNINNQKLASKKNKENSKQMTNKMISDNQLNGKEQETHNVIHNLKSKEERLIDAQTTKLIKESRVEEIEQEPKIGDEMETIVKMNVTLNQVADEDGFIQVTGKKNRKKTSIPIINKRPSSYKKDKEVKRNKVC